MFSQFLETQMRSPNSNTSIRQRCWTFQTARLKNRYTLPTPLKTDLHRWMIPNNICHVNGFRTDGVLDDFLKDYELFDQSKLPDIKGSSSDLTAGF